MIHLNPSTPHYLGQTQEIPVLEETPCDGRKVAFDLGLMKVAENRYICPSSKDFWRIEGGKLIRMSATEVDNGETLPPADVNEPEAFLASLLQELEF